MFSADIAALHQFLFDLGKIRFAQSNVKCVADRFQILDIIGSFWISSVNASNVRFCLLYFAK